MIFRSITEVSKLPNVNCELDQSGIEDEQDSTLEIRLFGGLSVPASPTRYRSPARSSETGSTTTADWTQELEIPDSKAIGRFRETLPEFILQKIQRTGELVDEAFLTRWLMARGHIGALKALEEHASWREEFIGFGGISLHEIKDEIQAQKICIQGVGGSGHPVLLFLANRHRRGTDSVKKTMQLLVSALDYAIGAADVSKNFRRQVVCIFDLRGMSRSFDIPLLKEIFDVLQKHYPEALSSLFFVDAPWIFCGVWRVISAFISSRTKNKISFVYGAKGIGQLHNFLGGNEILPQRLGGSAPLRPFAILSEVEMEPMSDENERNAFLRFNIFKIPKVIRELVEYGKNTFIKLMTRSRQEMVLRYEWIVYAMLGLLIMYLLLKILHLYKLISAQLVSNYNWNS